MTWQLASFALLVAALAAGFAWYERSHPSSKVLALVATLAALAALGRVAFAPLPNVKPTTDIVLLSGYVLGGAPGFAVGAVAALASNLVFGQGPWTPWQMAAWGLAGLIGAGARRGQRTAPRAEPGSRWPAALAGAALRRRCIDLSTWVAYSGRAHARPVPGDQRGLAVVQPRPRGRATSPSASRSARSSCASLERFRERFDRALGADRWPAVLAVVARRGRARGRARRARRLDRPRAGLPALGAEPRRRLRRRARAALHAAVHGVGGDRPRRLGPAPAPSPARYLARTAPRMRSRRRRRAHDPRPRRGGRLAAARGRRGPRRTGSRRAQRRDGSWAGQVNLTSFGILALRAAARRRRVSARAPRAGCARSRTATAASASRAGAARAGVDDTAAAVQALAAAGGRRSPAVRRAAGFLARRQNLDGGFPLSPGAASNAQSTAWAIQALVAAGRDPARARRRGSRSPLAYLRALVGPDGSVRYSRSSRQTPVWVTAQALAALARRRAARAGALIG